MTVRSGPSSPRRGGAECKSRGSQWYNNWIGNFMCRVRNYQYCVADCFQFNTDIIQWTAKRLTNSSDHLWEQPKICLISSSDQLWEQPKICFEG